nr:sensor histidine kinase [uncultured Blautia sp.]
MNIFFSYLNKNKLYLLSMLLSAVISGIIFYLYQLPSEAAVYITILWFLTGSAAFLYGYLKYRKKYRQLLLIRNAPEVNLDRLDISSDAVEQLYQEISLDLNKMRMDLETNIQKSTEDMNDYYTMWAHQIKTPIFALRLLLNENPEQNKAALAELFKVEEYVEMVLGYLRTENISSDLSLSKYPLDNIIREQIHRYAGIFISKKLSLTYDGTDETVLTDEKWLGFVIGQILSNSLKYTKDGGIKIYVQNGTLLIEDTGIGIRSEDLPRVFEKGYTGINGRDDRHATGIGLYLCKKILNRLGHNISIESEEEKGTHVLIRFPQENLTLY